MTNSSICVYHNVQMNLFKRNHFFRWSGVLMLEKEKRETFAREGSSPPPTFMVGSYAGTGVSQASPHLVTKTHRSQTHAWLSPLNTCVLPSFLSWQLCAVSGWKHLLVIEFFQKQPPGRAVWAAMATPVPDVRPFSSSKSQQGGDGCMWTNSCRLFPSPASWSLVFLG